MQGESGSVYPRVGQIAWSCFCGRSFRDSLSGWQIILVLDIKVRYSHYLSHPTWSNIMRLCQAPQYRLNSLHHSQTLTPFPSDLRVWQNAQTGVQCGGRSLDACIQYHFHHVLHFRFDKTRTWKSSVVSYLSIIACPRQAVAHRLPNTELVVWLLSHY